MKRLLVVGCLLLGLMAFLGSEARAEYDWSPGKFKDNATVGKKYRLHEGHFKELNYEYLQKTDADGNVEAYEPANRIVYITAATQLSSWSGQAATAGQSIFQMSPGTHYLVDLDAIARSGVTAGNGVSAFKTASFTGVTFIMFDASLYSGPAYDSTITLVYTGTSTYNGAPSGATMVSVWPFPGNSGLTAYGLTVTSYSATYRSSNTPYTMQTEYTANGSTVTNYVLSGASYWELDKIGESATFSSTANSAVSHFVRAKKVSN